ncbi:MAG TPA: DEAD/DEAH box helicase, partial [Allocoleopsis sp.]
LPDNVESYIHRIGRTGRAGNTGTAISIIQPIERRKLHLIERHVKQTLRERPIPTRSQIETRRLEKLKMELLEALTGERMASFLPVVSELSENYEPQAIAAAALQMFYDKTLPTWMQSDWESVVVEEESSSRPKFHKRGRRGDGDYTEYRDRHSRKDWDNHGDYRSYDATPKPKLIKRIHHETHAN